MQSQSRIIRLIAVIVSVLVGALGAVPALAQDACNTQVSTQQQLVDAITNAQTSCGGEATITLASTIETTSGSITDTYNQGTNAFPVIHSAIVIEGNGHTIIRNSSSSNHRFFSVGANGKLTLKNVTLAQGGVTNKGGAVLVYGDGGNATLNVLNSTLRNNTSSNDGGALQIVSTTNYSTIVTVENSALYENGGGPNNPAEGEGGAVYSDGRAGGTLQLNLINTDISNNIAGRDAGALRFLSAGAATITLNVENSNFMNNTLPQCVFHSSVTIGGSNRATDQSCGKSAIVQTCTLFAGTPDALSAAINDANDEVKCPGPDVIRLTANLQPVVGYQDGQSAFPAITSTIIIDGANTGADPARFTISRDASAPIFRFFLVNGSNGNKGVLTLKNLTLRGGGAAGALPGGAVFVDASGGSATLTVDTVEFIGNGGDNGGAVMTFSAGGGQVNSVIENSTFTGNSGAYGGAFYSGGFDTGNASALVINSSFTDNVSTHGGGAIYNNGLGNNGNGIATMTIENSTFTNNSAPGGGAITNNGIGMNASSTGNATLTLRGGTFTGNTATGGAGDALHIVGTEGSISTVTLPNAEVVGGGAQVCLSDDTGTLAVVACP